MPAFDELFDQKIHEFRHGIRVWCLGFMVSDSFVHSDLQLAPCPLSSRRALQVKHRSSRECYRGLNSWNRFLGPVYYTQNKEPSQNSRGKYLGPYGYAGHGLLGAGGILPAQAAQQSQAAGFEAAEHGAVAGVRKTLSLLQQIIMGPSFFFKKPSPCFCWTTFRFLAPKKQVTRFIMHILQRAQGSSKVTC